jgi:hypothetical protein
MIGSSILGAGSVIGFIVALLFLCLRQSQRAQRNVRSSHSTDDCDMWYGGRSKLRRRNRGRFPAPMKMGRMDDSDFVVDCHDDSSSEIEFQQRPNTMDNSREAFLVKQ